MRPPISWIFPGASLIADLLWLTAFFALLILPLLMGPVTAVNIFLPFMEIGIYCLLAAYYINKYKEFNGIVHKSIDRSRAEYFIKGLSTKYPLKPNLKNYKNHVQSYIFAGIIFIVFAFILLFFPFAS